MMIWGEEGGARPRSAHPGRRPTAPASFAEQVYGWRERGAARVEVSLKMASHFQSYRALTGPLFTEVVSPTEPELTPESAALLAELPKIPLHLLVAEVCVCVGRMHHTLLGEAGANLEPTCCAWWQVKHLEELSAERGSKEAWAGSPTAQQQQQQQRNHEAYFGAYCAFFNTLQEEARAHEYVSADGRGGVPRGGRSTEEIVLSVARRAADEGAETPRGRTPLKLGFGALGAPPVDPGPDKLNA